MILGTVLESKAVRTGYGLEYRVQYDKNPDAFAMSGLAGTALSTEVVPGSNDFWQILGGQLSYRQGDRVVLQYRSGRGYGLWFIVRKVGLGI